MENIEELKKFCRLLADESGTIIKKYYRSDIIIETKSDSTPVTIADKKSEEIIREMIMKEFPEHGIFGEEFGKYKEDSEYLWMLDPIDGTKSFISGVPLFGTIIALLKNKTPVLGVINNSILGEYVIGDNESCRLNDSIVKMRDPGGLENAILLSTDHLDVHEFQKGDNFEKLIRTVKLYRTWGDCYAYTLLAAGYADIMLDPIMSEWDTMALLIPIIKGAGGKITDYQGNDPVENPLSIIAAPHGLHERVVEILND